MLSERAQAIYDAAVKDRAADVLTGDGRDWTQVYLPAAQPSDLTPHQFAGYLSALEAAGLYQPDGTEGLFGLFLIQGEPQ